MPISDSVLWIGANDRETDKFEGLWSLPYGVVYNSYLIRGEKNILIDTVKSSFAGDYLAKLEFLLNGRPLDYVVVNHMEPDHSGSLGIIRRLWPGAKFIGNSKTAEMIKHFYGVEDGIVTVADGEALDLGSRKLVFAHVPMVHWPESMVAYDATEKILFSSDIFGGFGAVDGGIFDDEADMNLTEREMMRYFVNIVGRYAAPALKALAKVRTLEIGVICPAHGPVWRKDPERVIGLYERWSRQETEEGVVVVYGTMYGNTKRASDAIARGVSESGVRVVTYDAGRADMSFVTTDIWRHSGLVLSSCTYNMELFPPMASLIRHLENKSMKGRRIGLCGTYSWAGAALKEMSAFVERSKGGWALVEPNISIKSGPGPHDLEICGELGRNMAKEIKRGDGN